MDNLRSVMSSAGVFEPEEFAIVLDIYKEIAAEPWFSRSPEKRQDFARYILNAYRTGREAVEQFRFNCFAAARMSFSAPSELSFDEREPLEVLCA
jgi:hypothetical protein